MEDIEKIAERLYALEDEVVRLNSKVSEASSKRELEQKVERLDSRLGAP